MFFVVSNALGQIRVNICFLYVLLLFNSVTFTFMSSLQ